MPVKLVAECEKTVQREVGQVSERNSHEPPP
jgi:hypothetical protein